MEMYAVRYVRSSLLLKAFWSKCMGNIVNVVTIESDLNPVAHHVKKLMKPHQQ